MFPSDEVVPEKPVAHGDSDFIPLQPLSDGGKTTNLSSAVLECDVAVNMPPPKPGVFFFVLLILAAAWTVVGVSVFGLCFFSYKHYHAAIWALASAIFAGSVVHLQVLHLLRKLDVWHDVHTLGGLKTLAIIVSAACLIASVAYWALVVTRREVFSMAAGTLYPVATLSTITLLWGLLLYGSARHCQKRVAEANPALLSHGGYGVPDA